MSVYRANQLDNTTVQHKMVATILLILFFLCASSHADMYTPPAVQQGGSESELVINHYLLRASPESTTTPKDQAILTVTSSNDPMRTSIPLTYTFSNHSLSPACRHHPHRCRQLAILEEQDSLLGILTPLDDAIGFMCFKDIGKELVHQFTHTLAFTHHANCVPITIVEYRDKYYTVCIDSARRLISCLIILNFENITQSFLQCSTHLTLSTNVDYSSISNFVYVERDLFMFVVGNIVYKYYPDRFSIGTVPSCPLPHTAENLHLVFDGREKLLIYYRTNEGVDVTVPFNLAEECWDEFFPDLNLEYPCHNGFSVFVFPSASAILYETSPPSDDVLPTQISINGTNFTTGLCFGNESHSFFVYVDRLQGNFVLDIASQISTLLSNSTCSRDDCQTPVLYEERYLVLREDGALVVRDIELEYTIVIGASDDNDGLNGFFTGRPYEKEIVIIVGNRGNNDQILIGSAVGVPVSFVLILLFVFSILGAWYRLCRSQTLTVQEPPEHDRENIPLGDMTLKYVASPDNDPSQPPSENRATKSTGYSLEEDNSAAQALPDAPPLEQHIAVDIESLPSTTSLESTPTRTEATPTSPLLTQSLQDLYPDRASQAPQAADSPPPHTLTDGPSHPHTPTGNSGLRGLPSGASNESLSNVTMPEPIQASGDHSSIQLDCSSVLAPLPLDSSNLSSSPAHPRPGSLATRESTASREPLSSPSEYTPQQPVDFQPPVQTNSSQSPL